MIVLALGSNLAGRFGAPKAALRRALDELNAHGIQVISTSNVYETLAHTFSTQPNYVNAAAIVTTALPADSLLQVLKRIEAEAGRLKKSRKSSFYNWEPRPLDLDIVSYKGIVLNWKGNCPKIGDRVILPHPRAHERAFVLRPLLDLAPNWHHPVFGLTAKQLLKRPEVRSTGKILTSESSVS